MKIRVLTLTLACCVQFFTFSQDGIVWSTPTEVTGSTGGQRPRIELLSDNTPVLIWSTFGASDKDLYFSKWDGGAFAAPVALNDQSLLIYDWGGAELSADGDVLYTIFKEGPDVYAGRVQMRKSTDGGLTWGSKTMIEEAQGEITMYPNINAYNDSVVMVTYMVHENGGSNPQYIARRSLDAGTTFTQPQDVSENFGNEVCYCCPSAMAANDDYQVLAFRNDNNNVRDIKAGISTDNGLNFNTQISLDDNSWYLLSCPSSGPDVGLNGATLFSTYMSKGSGDEMVYFVQDDMSDANAYQSAPAMIDSLSDIMNFPEMDNAGDSVVIVWQVQKSGEVDLWYNISLDGMNQWAPENARKVFALPGTQTKPDVVVGADNVIHLVYVDEALDKVMYTTGTFSLATTMELTLSEMQLQPNPATSLVHIAGVSEQTPWELVNAQGKTVVSQSGPSINVADLPAGVYFVQIKGFKTEKLIVR